MHGMSGFMVQFVYLLAKIVSENLLVCGVGFGAVVALFTLQFLKLRRIRLASQADLFTRQSQDLQQLQRESSLQRSENRMLHEMLQQPNVQQMVELVLRSLVPQTQHGFAIFFRAEHRAQFTLASQRGLSQASKTRLIGQKLCFSEMKIDQTAQNCSMLQSNDIHRLLMRRLCDDDLSKSRELHGFFLHVGERPIGIVVTTRLFPVGFNESIQLEVTRRLFASLSVALSYAYEYEDQQSNLQLSSEILALRAITDGEFASPLKMLEGFCHRLMVMADAERGVLFLANPDGSLPEMPIFCVGKVHSAGVQKKWQHYERKLTMQCYRDMIPRFLSHLDLVQLEVESLIGSAIVTPIIENENLLGVLCMTRSGNTEFPRKQTELVNWATEFLAETIMRVVNQATIERDARIDPLTGLANRRAFERAMDSIAASKSNQGPLVTLCLVDADHFKQVNDRYGHQAGDDVLRFLGRLIREELGLVRVKDNLVAARYGGEELALLLPEMSTDAAVRLSESIRNRIQDSEIVSGGERIKVTVSIGISSMPGVAHNKDSLIKTADEALYRAKKNGRNRVCVAEVSQNSDSTTPQKTKVTH